MRLLALLLLSCFMLACTANFKGTLFRIQENGLYGFIDSSGNIVIEPQYKYVSSFVDDVALVVDGLLENKTAKEFVLKYYYIDKQNKLLMDTAKIVISEAKGYNIDTERFYDGSHDCVVSILTFGIAPSFDMEIFTELLPNDGLILFQDTETGLWGYKDLKGTVKISPVYMGARRFREGRSLTLRISNSYEFNVIDCEGKMVFESKDILSIKPYQNGYAWIVSSGNVFDGYEWLLLDRSGKIVAGPLAGESPLCHYTFEPFADNGYAMCTIDIMGEYACCTYVNASGDFLTDYNHDNELSFANEVFQNSKSYAGGYVAAQLANGQWVFMDERFAYNSKIAFDSTGYFSEGYAKVMQGETWGYIDDKLELVIPYRYDCCGDFRNGLAYFNRGDIEGYINKLGEVIWSTQRKYQDISIFYNR